MIVRQLLQCYKASSCRKRRQKRNEGAHNIHDKPSSPLKRQQSRNEGDIPEKPSSSSKRQQNRNKGDIPEKYLLPDVLWEYILPLLPPLEPKKKQGRPRMDDRKAINAIFYLLRTGIQWKALPRSLGASSTVHDRFMLWAQSGLFTKLWQQGVFKYDQNKGILWQWQAMDGSQTQAPKGGECVGKSYKHRGKNGTNRSILVEGRGVPLAAIAAAANRNDFKLTCSTLSSTVVDRPVPSPQEPQHLCLDKGYDYPEVDVIVAAFGYTAHIARKGEDKTKREYPPLYRARRWVVERTHSWLNNFRRLIIRWEKKVDYYLALLHFACAWISFHSAGVC